MPLQFNDFINDYAAELQPKGSLERALLAQITDADWNLRRLSTLEFHLGTEAGIDPFLSQDPEVRKKHARLMRYKMHYYRVFHRSWKEFETLRSRRPQNKATTKPPEPPDLESLYSEADPEKADLTNESVAAAT